MKTKKILFIVTKSNWGGAQRYVYDLAKGFHQRNYEVVVAFGGTGQTGSEEGQLAKRLEVANVRTIFIKNFQRDLSLVKEIKSAYEIVQIVRHEKPDIVHTVSSKAGGLGALIARLTGNTSVFSVLGFAFREPRSRVSQTTLRFLSWLTLLLSKHTICTTQTDYDTACAFPGVSAKKVSLVYNCIDPFQALEKTEAQIAIKHDAENFPTLTDSTLWLATGTELTANKGITYLLQALASLSERNDLHLFIIGTGELEHELKLEVAERGLAETVSFLGFVPDLASKLSAFDLFILPSLKEGLPYLVHEVANARLPLIASNVGAIPDVVEHDVTGYLTPPQDPNALASALQTLCDQPQKRQTMARAFHQQLHDRFDFESSLDEVEQVYSIATSTSP